MEKISDDMNLSPADFYKSVCAINGRFGIYPVITEKFCAGRGAVEVLKKIVSSGLVKIVQLREKDRSDRRLYETAVVFRRITESEKILFIVNDRVDVALAAGADGVHLGNDDLPVDAARKICLLRKFIIGASTHSLDEALKAESAGASYVNIGPVFPTRTKETAREHLGAEAISRIAPHLKIPFTVMGGIKEDNIATLAKNGARIFAMVTEITSAGDIVSKIRSLAQILLEESGT